MRSVFFPHLVNGPFGDPALFVRLAHRGEALLFDCGNLHPLSHRDMLKISAVFLSHAHIDHLVGFDTLLRLLLYRGQPLTLYGPPGILAQIENRLGSYTWNLVEGYPFVLRVCEWGPDGCRQAIFRAAHGFACEQEEDFSCPGGVICATPHYRVRAVGLDHGDIVSLAFTLEETLHVAIHKDALDRHGYAAGPWLTEFKDRIRKAPGSNAPVDVPCRDGTTISIGARQLAERIAHVEDGMKICYVTDASPTAANEGRILEMAADSHLLVIEATFARHESERARQRNHLTSWMAGDLARRAGAARLLVFHHSPRYQDVPDKLEREAQQAFTNDSLSDLSVFRESSERE